MKRQTIIDLRAFARTRNAEVQVHDYDNSTDSTKIEVHAPQGHVWADNGSASLVGYRHLNILGSACDCYEDLIDRMKSGLKPANQTPEQP